MDFRSVRDSEIAQAAELANLIFRQGEAPSMRHFFPHIFDSHFRLSVGAFDGDRLVAFVGMVPSWIRVGEARLRVCSLGSVCTHPDYRERRLAGELVDAAIRSAAQAGASLLFVSGTRSLYTRAGCRTFGAVHRVRQPLEALERLAKLNAEGVSSREAQPEDWFDLHELAENRPVRYEQSLYELSQLIGRGALSGLQGLSQRLYVSSKEGILTAYAVAAYRPMADAESSAEPSAVEWGGEPEGVVAAIAQASRELGAAGWNLEVPWHETDLLSFLSLAEEKPNASNQGTVKLLNAEALWRQLLPYLTRKNKSAADSTCVTNTEEGEVDILVEGRALRMAPEDWLAALFNPEAVGALPAPHGTVLADLLPVPLPHTAG